MSTRFRLVPIATLTSVACSNPAWPGAGLEHGSTSTGAAIAESSGDAPRRDDSESPPADLPRDDPPSGAVFIQDPDGGSTIYECSPWDQDCADGMKCTHYAADGHLLDSGAKCSPVVDDPSAPGEPCVVFGEWGSGVDSCERGGLCWNVDVDTLEGVCIAYCVDPTLLLCPEGTHCIDSRHLGVCEPFCCPLEQSCPEGSACYPIDGGLLCAEDASGDAGGFGHPCEYINVCDPGLLCADADSVGGCETGAPGCCTRFCSVSAADPCESSHPRMQCVPYFVPDDTPPGFEDVGICMLPE